MAFPSVRVNLLIRAHENIFPFRIALRTQWAPKIHKIHKIHTLRLGNTNGSVSRPTARRRLLTIIPASIAPLTALALTTRSTTHGETDEANDRTL